VKKYINGILITWPIPRNTGRIHHLLLPT